jgi:uncharacterized protein involved in outer membrane biogenesis
MKIFKKILLLLLILVVVGAISGVIVVGFYLGDIVKAGMEKVGPQVAKVSVNVDKVTISLLSGSASVKGLVLGNPDGFTAPQSISLGEASVGLSPMSVFSDKIVVRSVRVIAPDITIEGNLLNGNNNLSKIVANLNDSQKSGGPAAPNTPTTSGKPAKKIEVDDLLITGAKVHYGSTTLPLPDIHLTDLGKSEDGITAADLTKRILSQVTMESVKAVALQATNLGKSIEDLGKSVGGNAGTTVNQGVDKIKKGLGGLFGK